MPVNNQQNSKFHSSVQIRFDVKTKSKNYRFSAQSFYQLEEGGKSFTLRCSIYLFTLWLLNFICRNNNLIKQIELRLN